LVAWIIDAQNFVLKYFDAIQESALHLYHSALPFCPTKSFLRQHHRNLLTEEVHVKLGLDEDWETTFRTIKTKSSKLSSVIFAQDGSLIATSGDHSVQIFHAATGACLATMVLSGLHPKAIAFSGDNIYLLSSWDDKGVRLWDVQTGDLVRNCVGWHKGNVIDVAFSAKSNRFSSLDDHGQICVQSTVSGILECTLKADKGTVYCLWSPEDNILMTYAPTIILCFNILSQLSVQSFQEHQNSPSTLTINNMRPLVVWMKKDVVVFHNLLTHEEVNALVYVPYFEHPPLHGLRHKEAIRDINETLQLIQGAGKNSQKSGKPAPKYIVLSPDGKLLIIRKYEQLQVYNLQSGSPKPEAVFKWSDKESDVIFAPDGAYLALASAQDGTVSFCHWDADSLGSRSHAAITYVCTSPDGKLITSGQQDGNVNIWSLKSGYEFFTKEVSYGRSVEALALSPDKRYIAIRFAKSNAQNISIQVWDVVYKLEAIQQLDVHQTIYFDPTLCVLKFLDNNNLMHMVVSEARLHFHSWTLKSGKFEPYKKRYINLFHTIERPWFLEADDRTVVLHHSGNLGRYIRFTFENTKKCTFNAPMQNRYHIVVEDNWILDGKGRRIIWLPHDVVPSDGNWDGKGNWGSHGGGVNKLVLGGKNGKTFVLNFSKVKDITPTSLAEDVAQNRIEFVFQDEQTG